MADQWFYSQNGKQSGPAVSFQELQQAAAEGGLLPTDFVWKAGMTEWTPAAKINGLFDSPPPLPPPLPTAENRSSDPFDFLKPDGSPPVPTGGNKHDGDVCILAYISLGLVCVSLVTGLLLAIPGIVCGHIALNQCNRNPRMKEKNYAVAALIAGYVVLGLLVLTLVGLFTLPGLIMNWHR